MYSYIRYMYVYIHVHYTELYSTILVIILVYYTLVLLTVPDIYLAMCLLRISGHVAGKHVTLHKIH